MRRAQVVVKNVDPLSLKPDDVSLIVACAGYEPRATFLAECLVSRWGGTSLVGERMLLLEFNNFSDMPSRRAVDAFFSGVAPRWRVPVSKDSGLDVLRSVSARSGGRGTVVVDYSCMSRLLYLSLVQLVYDGWHVVFSYSLGKYGAAALDYPVSSIGEIRPVPGLEGVHYHSRPTLHVFGLGYDGVGTLALVDKLEASRVVTFWAEPGASPESAGIARKENEQLIHRSLAYFSRDLRDGAGAVAVLSRLAFDAAPFERVVFVPVGPKPHVLACALASAPHEHCSVLAPYLGKGGMRSNVPLVEASGEVVGLSARVGARAQPHDAI